MRVFDVSVKALKFGDRLVPLCYFYSQEVAKEHSKKGIVHVRLGDYAAISDGEHSAIPRRKEIGIRYLYGRNIKEGIIDFDPISDEPYISEADYEDFNRCHIQQDDVLIAIYGTVGKSAVYKEEYVGPAGIPRHISNITIKKNAPFSPEYLTAFFRSKFGKWQMQSVMTGNIQQLLSLKNLREFEIPLASDSIIENLTDIEREAVNCEVEANKLLKEAQDLFYSGLGVDLSSIRRDLTFSVKFSELNESGIWTAAYYDKLYVKIADAIAANNMMVTLRELVDVATGDEVGSDNYNEYVERSTDDKPFIRTSDIVNNEVDLFPDYYLSKSAIEGLDQDIKPGDVIFTKDGKIGCTGMIVDSDDVVISSGLAKLRLKQSGVAKSITQEYLFMALSTPEVGRFAAMRRTVVASTIPHLRVERLKDIEVPIEDGIFISKITEKVKKAFSLKSRRKNLLKTSENILDNYFL